MRRAAGGDGCGERRVRDDVGARHPAEPPVQRGDVREHDRHLRDAGQGRLRVHLRQGGDDVGAADRDPAVQRGRAGRQELRRAGAVARGARGAGDARGARGAGLHAGEDQRHGGPALLQEPRDGERPAARQGARRQGHRDRAESKGHRRLALPPRVVQARARRRRPLFFKKYVFFLHVGPAGSATRATSRRSSRSSSAATRRTGPGSSTSSSGTPPASRTRTTSSGSPTSR